MLTRLKSAFVQILTFDIQFTQVETTLNCSVLSQMDCTRQKKSMSNVIYLQKYIPAIVYKSKKQHAGRCFGKLLGHCL